MIIEPKKANFHLEFFFVSSYSIKFSNYSTNNFHSCHLQFIVHLYLSRGETLNVLDSAQRADFTSWMRTYLSYTFCNFESCINYEVADP